MILVDHQIADLCQGTVPSSVQAFYSLLGWEDCPSRIAPMVEPYDYKLINPHSLDVRIGETAKLRVKESFLCMLWRKFHNWLENQQNVYPPRLIKISKYQDIDLSKYSQKNPYLMQPGDRLLVESVEVFNIPEFTASSFYLKSSRGREWYGHQLAGYIDAGWHGSRLTMEITNDDLAPLPIYPGMKFGQLEFRLLLGLPAKSYAKTGRYNNDLTVQESKG
jgi:deoxycytidine triphosphate deaminase